MKNLIMRSHAKINICLNINGKRDDGYHLLDSVMLPLEMHDVLIISELKKSTDNFVTMDDMSNCQVKCNLVTTALDELSTRCNFDQKFRIYIHKTIPMRAGLGGGSSNAATALLGINKYLKLGVSDEEFIEISTPIGADVPFFIKTKPMHCTGIGEIMEPIQIKNNYYVLIVKPKDGCGTKAMFEVADTMDLKTGNVADVIDALEKGDDEKLANSIFNSLQEVGIKMVPEIANVIELLKGYGLSIVQMTGSGSAVFAMSTDKKLIKNAYRKIDESNHYFVELTKVKK